MEKGPIWPIYNIDTLLVTHFVLLKLSSVAHTSNGAFKPRTLVHLFTEVGPLPPLHCTSILCPPDLIHIMNESTFLQEVGRGELGMRPG